MLEFIALFVLFALFLVPLWYWVDQRRVGKQLLLLTLLTHPDLPTRAFISAFELRFNAARINVYLQDLKDAGLVTNRMTDRLDGRPEFRWSLTENGYRLIRESRNLRELTLSL